MLLKVFDYLDVKSKLSFAECSKRLNELLEVSKDFKRVKLVLKPKILQDEEIFLSRNYVNLELEGFKNDKHDLEIENLVNSLDQISVSVKYLKMLYNCNLSGMHLSSILKKLPNLTGLCLNFSDSDTDDIPFVPLIYLKNLNAYSMTMYRMRSSLIECKSMEMIDINVYFEDSEVAPFLRDFLAIQTKLKHFKIWFDDHEFLFQNPFNVQLKSLKIIYWDKKVLNDEELKDLKNLICSQNKLDEIKIEAKFTSISSDSKELVNHIMYMSTLTSLEIDFDFKFASIFVNDVIGCVNKNLRQLKIKMKIGKEFATCQTLEKAVNTFPHVEFLEIRNCDQNNNLNLYAPLNMLRNLKEIHLVDVQSTRQISMIEISKLQKATFYISGDGISSIDDLLSFVMKNKNLNHFNLVNDWLKWNPTFAQFKKFIQKYLQISSNIKIIKFNFNYSMFNEDEEVRMITDVIELNSHRGFKYINGCKTIVKE